MASWEICDPGVWHTIEPIGEGCCSIDKAGKMTLLAADAKAAGIDKAAIVLADVDLLRIALQAPKPETQHRTVPVRPVVNRKGKDRGLVALNVRPGIRKLGLTTEAVRGRFALTIKGGGRETLLIVNLAGEKSPTSKTSGAAAETK